HSPSSTGSEVQWNEGDDVLARSQLVVSAGEVGWRGEADGTGTVAVASSARPFPVRDDAVSCSRSMATPNEQLPFMQNAQGKSAHQQGECARRAMARRQPCLAATAPPRSAALHRDIDPNFRPLQCGIGAQPSGRTERLTSWNDNGRRL
ncbi:hypothetical protein TOPH_03882, partial [Tolypocladium ophioglossoides CBS 100239]